MDAWKQEAVGQVMRANPNATLKELKDKLGREISYGEIKLVQAHLSRE